MKMGKWNINKLEKTADITIGDDKYTLKTLGSEYLDLFMNEDKKDMSEINNKLILASLKQCDASITMDDIKTLPLFKIMELIKAISEINGLE